MNTALEFQNVDIVFPSLHGRKGAQQLSAALAALDAGATRAEIATRLSATVGVAGASLHVVEGHISVLMGLSGSGKSTLLRAANGLNLVSRGHVYVRDGEQRVDVASCTREALRGLRRRRIAMVFQQFGLLPWRSVRENVGLGLELRGEAPLERRRIVEEKLELVGLSQWADRQVAELSGGMQQRVGLARAFATDADILLMDEPFSALDPLIRTKLQDELCALQERVRKTILFVSHDLDEALRLGDQITIMDGGRIIQSGTAEDIVMRPANDYVGEFVRHMNPLSMLTGAMVMRSCAALERVDGAVCLDAQGRYRVQLDAQQRPVGARVDGTTLPVLQVLDSAALPVPGAPGSPEAGLAMVSAALPLQAIIHWCVASGHPVLVGEGGVLHGVCGETEIIRALAGKRGVVPTDG